MRIFLYNLIRPELLDSAGTETIYKTENSNIKNQIRDIHKYYNESDVQIVSFGIENQTNEDRDMVIRVLGYDYAGYREQIDSGKTIRYPIITIVLNFGDKKWSKLQIFLQRRG